MPPDDEVNRAFEFVNEQKFRTGIVLDRFLWNQMSVSQQKSSEKSSDILLRKKTWTACKLWIFLSLLGKGFWITSILNYKTYKMKNCSAFLENKFRGGISSVMSDRLKTSSEYRKVSILMPTISMDCQWVWQYPFKILLSLIVGHLGRT